MKKVIISIIVISACAFGGWYIFLRPTAATAESYSLAELQRGDLECTISSSGTLSPVTTVEIGTQVSGTIDSVYVDFNDEIKKDQILAVLDTILLRTSVLDAEAGVEKAEALLEKALADYKRFEPIYDKGLISEGEFFPYGVAVKTQKATLKSAGAALQRARQNLKYAVIKSPINGTVIERAVETGQTVAASLSTPTLFIIVEDLSRMEILVEVDESDIGLIRQGQTVRFEVQTYSDKIFGGKVTQIRLQPKTISNVVTYTVVVDAANEDYLLLPGMTATVDFILEKCTDVLLVPNAALRFRPSDEKIAEFRERRRAERGASSDSTGSDRKMRSGGLPGSGGGMMGQGSAGGGPKRSDMTMLWFLDNNGNLGQEPVRTGMTDGSSTEIVRSRSLVEGSQIIIGQAKAGSKTSSPNKSNRMISSGPPGRGPGF